MWVNCLRIIKKSNALYLVVTIVLMGILPCCSYIDKWIFLNRTASMPMGFYIKTNKDILDVGDIIVFRKENVNLIKYVAAIQGSEYCFDHEKVMWINGQPVGQKNIQKYLEPNWEQSVCYALKSDELLVLGEHPDSYDSRYFGPIKIVQMIAAVDFL